MSLETVLYGGTWGAVRLRNTARKLILSYDLRAGVIFAGRPCLCFVRGASLAILLSGLNVFSGLASAVERAGAGDRGKSDLSGRDMKWHHLEPGDRPVVVDTNARPGVGILFPGAIDCESWR